MSQAATPSLVPSDFAGASHFLLRRLHSLTGLVFGGYLVIHLITNATLIQGTSPDVFQSQVDKIHSLPFLWAIEWLFIYLPILFHTVYGIWIIVGGRLTTIDIPTPKIISIFSSGSVRSLSFSSSAFTCWG